MDLHAPFPGVVLRVAIVLWIIQHELANEIGDFIGGGIEGEMSGIKDVNLSLRNVPAVRSGLG